MREFDQSYCMIPLMFDLSSASVLVIGAGAVGQRKAAYFAGRCKELTILDTVPESLSDIVAAHDFIVAATASSEENERIIGEARVQNKWYNCATGIGNFLIPAAHFEENFTLNKFMLSLEKLLTTLLMASIRIYTKRHFKMCSTGVLKRLRVWKQSLHHKSRLSTSF